MNDHLISLYIDDELDLDEKIVFVETVHHDHRFTDEALALLRQEKRLRAELAEPPRPLPPAPVPARARPRLLAGWLGPLAGCAATLLLVGLFTLPGNDPVVFPREEARRFVVYLPDSSQTMLVGTFTDWHPVPMERVGASGYWTLTLPVAAGEHRYSYLVGDGRRIADPTVVTREADDFGGENSVIEVGVRI